MAGEAIMVSCCMRSTNVGTWAWLVHYTAAPHAMTSSRPRPLTPSLQDIAALPCRWFAFAINYTFVRPCMNTRPLGQPILAEELLGYQDVKVSISNTFPLHFRARLVELD